MIWRWRGGPGLWPGCAAAAVLAAAAAGCAAHPGIPHAWTPELEALQPVADLHTLVGCYRAGEWSFALDSVPALVYWNAPPQGALQAWTYAERSRGDVYWSVTRDGYAEVVEFNGLDGATTRFRASGDILVGSRDWWADYAIRPHRANRIIAVRVPCPGNTAGDDPPPSQDQLRTTFVRGLATMLRDSVLPRHPIRLLPARAEVPFLTKWITSMLHAGAQTPDSIYGMRLEVEMDSVTRNHAVATVATSLCDRRSEVKNLEIDRVRYGFERATGGWRLISSVPLSHHEGACGDHLLATPSP